MDRLPNIAQAIESMRAGKLKPIELVEFCIARIDRFDEKIRAWVLIDREAARRQAELLFDKANRGDVLGLLHGIPIGVKDIVDVAGLPTVARSPLRKGHIAKRDAPAVASLKRAGAIILGKTVTTQFACFDPPPTKNPWNEHHTPGGSSSGSAAAVAMQMCMAAIGSQTGGSITRPATYCGVSGMKPTFGTVRTDGVIPVSPHLDHVGPMARSADDLCWVFDVVRKRDDRLTESLEPLCIAGQDMLPDNLILGTFRHYFSDHCDPEYLDVFHKALDKIQTSQNAVQRLDLPDSFNEVHAMHRRIMAVDAAEFHRRQFQATPEAFAPKLAELIEEGLSTRPADYQSALEHQRTFSRDIRRIIGPGVFAITPATNTAAPSRLDTTGDPRFNSPWSYSGLPTVSIPCGIDGNGMPCGLQIVGSAGNDNSLLRLAVIIEQRIGKLRLPYAC